ncbi:MAG TPA: asparaginase domain-containing protein [Patescibacteria group bacterium]|nr:asparaginase domain-containing protein [Patescibacteria group bacterium]
MARIAIVFTGGTISMRIDPVAGGNMPVLGGAALLETVPGLSAIADLVPIDRGLTPASHFTFDALFGISRAVADALAADDVDGAVVVQGTDTIEETAFFLDLLHHGQKPIVVTGAMRSASFPDYDGPANLLAAVAVAADPAVRAADVGVVVVLDGSIEPADDVTKTHASAFDTFRSLNRGPLGRVVDGAVRLSALRGPRRRVAAERAAPRVFLVSATVASDGTPIAALHSAGADGFVVAATGAGNTSAALLEAAAAAIADDLPVVLVTRCPAGAASDGYAFPGGGATWVRAGAMPAGHLTGEKARIALALGIGAGLGRSDLATLLADPAPIHDRDHYWETG